MGRDDSIEEKQLKRKGGGLSFPPFFLSFDIQWNNRLLLDLVQGNGTIAGAREINSLQIDTADGTVVHGAEIDDPVCDVRCRSPLRGARNVDGGSAR